MRLVIPFVALAAAFIPFSVYSAETGPAAAPPPVDVVLSGKAQPWVTLLLSDTSPSFVFITPPKTALIPAGSFVMGATTNVGHDYYDTGEIPQHTVYVGSFFIDQVPVTKALWDDVYNWAIYNGYVFDGAGYAKGADHPVIVANWYDAAKWCNARSEKDGRKPAYYTSAVHSNSTVYRSGQYNVENNLVEWDGGYRLPTEAEWEKAARGGTVDHRFSWSDSDSIDHSRANYFSYQNIAYDLSPEFGYHPAYTNGAQPYTSPVEAFEPNDYGLYDMTGNVREWCWDHYISGYYTNSPASNPRGPLQGRFRVLRGGGWLDPAAFCRVSYRAYALQESEGYAFRTVVSPP